MEFIERESSLANHVGVRRLLSGSPFVVVDVGCAGGIDEGWRCFGDSLIAYGFDANTEECAKLQAMEMNPRVTYTAGFVGLPSDHRFLVNRGGSGPVANSPWTRFSAAVAMDRAKQSRSSWTPKDRIHFNAWQEGVVADEASVISLPQYLAGEAVSYLDFLKIDVDGEDLAVLVSIADSLSDLNTLGIAVEVNFVGSDAPTDNSFHNTDRLLRSLGFDLFHLSTRRYATAALPYRFVFDFPAQTVGGRVVQGDAIYFRDLAHLELDEARSECQPITLVKLACLYELFGLSDCAAELLVRFRPILDDVLPYPECLDAMVPTPWRRFMGYQEYIARFEADDPIFYGPRGNYRGLAREGVQRVSSLLERWGRSRTGTSSSSHGSSGGHQVAE